VAGDINLTGTLKLGGTTVLRAAGLNTGIGILALNVNTGISCLNRVIPFGERHLRRTITEFIEHYHGERNHQGLGNELIDGAPPVDGVNRIHRRQRLGGLLNYYARAA
jgi:hypothetical protein